jgi:hypothetical protein
VAPADQRRTASADVLSAADENAQKSKLNVRKTNPRKLLRLAASCAASSQQRASDRGTPPREAAHNPLMEATQTKIIELLREVHLLAIKEVERLNLRISGGTTGNDLLPRSSRRLLRILRTRIR